MNKIVFSTRMLPEAAAAAAAHAGCSLQQAELLQFDFTPAYQQVNVLEALIKQPLRVVFTSSQAVHAIRAAIPGASPQWNIACCGTHTAELIQQTFTRSSLYTIAPNATALAEQLLQGQPGQNWIYLCGRQRLDVLPKAFEAAAKKLPEYPLYETRQIAVKLAEAPDAVLFFSPSTVHAFLQENAWPPLAIAICMGPTTAKALESQCPTARMVLANPATKWGALQTALAALRPA